MKIIIFTENNRAGGMDAFITSLINNWPIKQDSFTVICNQSHPGIPNMANLLPDGTKLSISKTIESIANEKLKKLNGKAK